MGSKRKGQKEKAFSPRAKQAAMRPNMTESDSVFSEHGTDDDMRVDRHIPPLYISTNPTVQRIISWNLSICRGFPLGFSYPPVHVDGFWVWMLDRGQRR